MGIGDRETPPPNLFPNLEREFFFHPHSNPQLNWGQPGTDRLEAD